MCHNNGLWKLMRNGPGGHWSLQPSCARLIATTLLLHGLNMAATASIAVKCMPSGEKHLANTRICRLIYLCLHTLFKRLIFWPLYGQNCWAVTLIACYQAFASGFDQTSYRRLSFLSTYATVLHHHIDDVFNSLEEMFVYHDTISSLRQGTSYLTDPQIDALHFGRRLAYHVSITSDWWILIVQYVGHSIT